MTRQGQRFTVACFINGDADLLGSWLDHYRELGADEFWFVLHGAGSANEQLESIIAGATDMHVLDRETREFDSKLRVAGCQRLVERLRDHWLMLVDSDEFVQLPPPHRTMASMAEALLSEGADCLAAPMLHRITHNGTLNGYDGTMSLSSAYPLGAPILYDLLGIPEAKTAKHPFFLNHGGVRYERIHDPPPGARLSSRFQGTTHHYKWRASARERVTSRANSNHTWASSSQTVADYLTHHDWRLPVEGTFAVSTDELLKRGWLKS